MTTIQSSFLQGKTGRIYIARKGTITVYLLDDGSSYFTNNTSMSSVITKGPVPSYWRHSIDFAGGFSDYFTTGMMYDTEDRPNYPESLPLTPLTHAYIAKLKQRAGL